jgi:DNA-directed RNA polymerase specialized sigma24 family protein
MDLDPDQTSDEQILAALRGNEQSRLTALQLAMDKYASRLAGLARTKLGDFDPHDVQDVVDRTFHALWENSRAITTSLKAWLGCVVINQSNNLLRQKFRRKELAPVSLQDQAKSGLSLEESGELMLIAQGLENPWSGLIVEEFIEQFGICIGKLPPTQKMVGSLMLEAMRTNGEFPDNEAILKEVRKLTGTPAFSLEAMKSAKKQVLEKLRSTISSREKREQQISAS